MEERIIDKMGTLERILFGIILLGMMSVVGIGLYQEHREKMQNNPEYKQEYLESRKESNRILNEFTRNCKWCYGR